MKKKVYLIVSLIILIVGLFAGCGEIAQENQVTPSPVPEDAAPTEEPEDDTGFEADPEKTIEIKLTGKGSEAENLSYKAIPGEILEFTYDCKKTLSTVNYTITPEGGLPRTVVKSAAAETPGTFHHYITITESMAKRDYTVRAAGFDSEGNETVSFEPVYVSVERNLFTMTLCVDGKDYTLHAYNESYTNDTYICLSEVEKALKGTKKACEFDRRGDKNYSSRWLNVNGELRLYYTYLHFGEMFAKTDDVCIMADLNMTEKDGKLCIDTGESFAPDVKKLEQQGYFNSLGGALLGNLETGEIYFSKDANVKRAIASVSKLMTWVVLRDAIKSGAVSASDTVTVPLEATAMSLTSDGIYYLKEGAKIPLEELVAAMMLVSSNESAIAIACHVAGSENAFVELMNKKAEEIGLPSAEFHTCSGVPTFSGKVLSSKLENYMNLDDLFYFIRHLLVFYPEITEITSKQYYKLPSLGVTATNQNPAIFNVTGALGLKTGSTNLAGSCLATVTEINKNGKKERIVSLVFGAYSVDTRDRFTYVLLKYAQNLD